MSYHARIGKPLLIVTGRTGACGNTKRIAQRVGQPHLIDDRHEVVAVGAESVEPDDRCVRMGTGLEFDGGQDRGHGGCAKKSGILPSPPSAVGCGSIAAL